MRSTARVQTVGDDGASDEPDSGSITHDSEDLRKRAFRLLARRERSRAEMQRLLGARCSNEQAVSSLLTDLQERGWLSDARLADQLAGSRRHRASATRIRQQMARRGLDAESIAAATAGFESTDLATALALWQKRFGEPAADRAQRERQLRFLRYRGFSHTLALKVLRMAGAAAAAELEE